MTLVDGPLQQAFLQLLKQGHDHNEDDNHEDEAHPHLVKQTKVGVQLDIVAHAGSCTVHLSVNQHDEGVAQSVDEAAKDGGAGSRSWSW